MSLPPRFDVGSERFHRNRQGGTRLAAPGTPLTCVDVDTGDSPTVPTDDTSDALRATALLVAGAPVASPMRIA
jgi:hypothetical protein